MNVIGKDNVLNRAIVVLTYDEATILMRACGVPPANRATTLVLDLSPIANQVDALTILKQVSNQITDISTIWNSIKDAIEDALET